MSTIAICNFQYFKIKEIGRGNFGVVHLIDDPQLAGQFAAKEIPCASFPNGAFETYYAEAQAMHASACPHVVKIRAAGRNTDYITLIMEHYKNGSLEGRIRFNPLSPLDSIHVGQDMLIGLAAIHRSQITHFDIKPSNVLFDDQGRALVADFGQARRIGKNGFANAPGMYQWGRPPEAVSAFAGNQLSDVYQVGLTLYRAVNGEAFYKEQATRYPVNTAEGQAKLERAIITGKFPQRNAFQPHVPDGLRRVIRKALRVDPARRYQNADDFDAALGKVNPALNWIMTRKQDGNTRWEASRDRHASLIVDLLQEAGSYEVEVRSVSGGCTRKKQEGSLWRKGMSADEADLHLQELFTSLP